MSRVKHYDFFGYAEGVSIMEWIHFLSHFEEICLNSPEDKAKLAAAIVKGGATMAPEIPEDRKEEEDDNE